MVRGSALAVDRLSVVVDEQIHLARGRERLQRPVDGRQAYGLTTVAQQVVYLLRGTEAVLSVEQFLHRGSLTGLPYWQLRVHARSRW